MAGSVTKVAGLFTSPNSISSVPEGALKKARNCVINFPNTIESRRGFEDLGYGFGITTDRAAELFAYQGHVLVQYGTKLCYDSGTAFVDYTGTNEPPNAAVLRMKGAEAAQNFYYTSTTGVKLLDSYTGTPTQAGIPQAPPPSSIRYPTLKTGDPDAGWLPVNTQVAYISTLSTVDANGNFKESQGSTPIYVVNPPDVALAVGALGGFGPVPGIGVAHTHTRATLPDQQGTLYDVGDKLRLTLNGVDTDFTAGIRTLDQAYQYLEGDYIWWPDTAGLTDLSVVTATLSSGAKNVSVSIDLPDYATTNMVIRFYRSQTSVSYEVAPNPDYFLIHEHQVTGADLTAGYYQFTDSIAILSPVGYYNNVNYGGETPDGDPDNENARPPKCNDLCIWNDRLWGANYTFTQSLTVNLLATGGPNGLVAGDTVTVGGVTYTAVEYFGYSNPALPANQFYVYGLNYRKFLDAPALRVALTAQSLALAVSKDPSGLVYGYSIAEDAEFPGELFFESRDPGGSALTFYVSRPGCWNPEMGSTLSGALTFDTDVATNGVWFSKQGQPEAVPRLNRLSVGPTNGNILRFKPLGERLFVFTDRGIYTISGTYPYRVDLLSKTAILLAPDSLADFDDALYALTTQGVVRISDAGVGIISVPIEADVKRLFGDGLATLKTAAHGVGYESYRKYIINLPTTPAESSNTQGMAYDVANQTWTQIWDKAVRCAVVEPVADYLYIAQDENRLSRERKTFSRWDYVDESWAVTVTAHSGKVVTLADATGLAAGDLLYQAEDCNAVVVSVNGNDVTVKTTEFWTDGLATTAYAAIESEFQFIENHGGAPNIAKKWTAVNYHWRSPGFSTGVALASTENTPADAEIPADLSGWGDAAFGAYAWAIPNTPKNLRVITGRMGAYLTVGFRIREALAVWSLYGYTPEILPMSERSTR